MSSFGKALLESAGEALRIARGEADPDSYRVHVPPGVDVAAIRRKHGLSQRGFAARYGFAVSAVRDWEQGRRKPDQSARVLLERKKT